MSAIRVRDVVRLYAGTKDGRTGVVMRLFPEDGRAVVLSGTSSHYAHEPFVAVERHTRDGIALGLTSETTYFFQRSGFSRPRLDALDPLGRPCPPSLFLKLERLIGQVAASTPPRPVDEAGSGERATEPSKKD